MSYISALNNSLKAKGMRVDFVTCSHSDCTGDVDFITFFEGIKKTDRAIKTIELNDSNTSCADICVETDQLGDRLAELVKQDPTQTNKKDIDSLISTFVDSCKLAGQSLASGKTPGT